MGKRQTARQQRRRYPDYKKARPGPGPRVEPLPSAAKAGKGPAAPRLTKTGLPLLRSDEELFGPPAAAKTMQESFAELVEESLADPDQRRALRQKQRGRRSPLRLTERLAAYPAPQEELDLHRLTGQEAERRIENFLQTARGRGLLTLRIITGRGRHSEGPAVLPEVAEHKLLELKERRLVLAYRWEKRKKERSGALLVYLPGK
jgi:DNA-nicking Smr family endonuclease